MKRTPATLLAAALLAASAVGVVVAAQQAQADPQPVRGVVAAASTAAPDGLDDGTDRTPVPVDTEPVPFAEFEAFDGDGEVFRTRFIPAGWTVQSEGADALVLAPPGADPDPDLFLGKIMASVGVGYAERKPAGDGLVRDRNEDGSVIVEIDRPDGTYLAVQFPGTTGGEWSDEELLEFARGVTVVGTPAPAAG
jgi:hypothetical protein